MTNDQTALVPALLYESLPKPSPYPFETSPVSAQSRPAHRFEIRARIPFYPGAVYQAPTPGYPPTPLEARAKPPPQTSHPHPPRPRPEVRDPHTPRRTGSLSGLAGYQIRELLIRAASPPATVSLLNPTGEFARQVDAVRRAREAEETIPRAHLPRRGLSLRSRWRLGLPRIRKRCRDCRHLWPCQSLTKYLRSRHGDDIGLAVFRLSTRRLRARAERRSRTTITHRARPRRVDREERALGLS